MWSTGEGNGKPLRYSCLENPLNSMKRQKDRTLKDELPRSVGTPWMPIMLLEKSGPKAQEGMNTMSQSINNARLWMSGGESEVQCCKEWYCIGTWNVRSMNQGKLEVVKQEMERVNINILGISELKWTGMGKFNADDHYIYYCGQEPLEEME